MRTSGSLSEKNPLPPFSRAERKAGICFHCLTLIILCGSGLIPVSTSQASAQSLPSKCEIIYQCGDAGDVTLLWRYADEEKPGQVSSSGQKPNKVIMERRGDSFAAGIPLRMPSTIRYSFLINRSSNGDRLIPIPDYNEPQWKLLAIDKPEIRISVASKIPPDRFWSARLSRETVQFLMPGTDEVKLYWGINGWKPVPESIRPENTFVKDGVMHTPMVQSNGIFYAHLWVPIDSTYQYGFLYPISKPGSTNTEWITKESPSYNREVKAPAPNLPLNGTVTMLDPLGILLSAGMLGLFGVIGYLKLRKKKRRGLHRRR